MADKDTGTGFAIGFIVGAAVGLAIGFLYAPRPGEETRELLKEKTAKVAEKVKDVATEAKQKAGAKMAAVKEQIK